MRRTILLFLLLVCIAVTGCTAAVNPPAESAVQTGGAEETPRASTSASDPLVLLTYHDETMEQYVDAMQRKYDIEVEWAESGNSDYEKMLLDFAAGKATYDVVCVGNALGNLYTSDTLLDKGYYLPLSDVPLVAESISQMHPVLQAQVMRDGIPYALPYYMQTKVLEYDTAIYDAVAQQNLDDYAMYAGVALSPEEVAQLPEMETFDTWETLLDNLSLGDSGALAYNAILEQCILVAEEEGFSFASPFFEQALELMKRAYTSKGGVQTQAARISFNPYAFYTGGWPGQLDSGEPVFKNTASFAPPTLDPQGRLAMAYDVLAVNAFTDKKEQAFHLLETAADIGLNGFEGYDESKQIVGYIGKYGIAYTAACYADDDHIRVVAGDDPANQQRWREITQRLAPITETGFLTAFTMEIFPMYVDGAITTQQCARMTQERYEMYKLEQG